MTFWPKSVYWPLLSKTEELKKHCFSADRNPKRSGLSPTQQSRLFPTVGFTILTHALICRFFLLLQVKRMLTPAQGVQQRAEAPRPIRDHPCPVTSVSDSQHPLWQAPEQAQQAAMPLPARASRTLYTCPCLTQHNFCILLNPGFLWSLESPLKARGTSWPATKLPAGPCPYPPTPTATSVLFHWPQRLWVPAG